MWENGRMNGKTEENGSTRRVVGEVECKRCHLHKTRHRIVWGMGGRKARVMVVGEAPGVNENRKGRPWIGSAGTETRHLMLVNRVDPQKGVYWTNMLKCWPPDDADPPDSCLDACLPYLIQELSEVEPEVIVTLGRFSSRFFLGEDVLMDRVNGIPFRTDWGIVVPILHPAAGLRRSEDMVKVQYGFGVLRGLMRGEIEPRPYEMGKLEGEYKPFPSEMQNVYMTARCIAIDTEWAQGKPFCLTTTHIPKRAYMVKAEQVEGLIQLDAGVTSDYCEEVVIHNAAYDLPVLDKMGIVIPTEKLRDSMVAAYLLQSEPQGLKDLAWRILGKDMDDYTEVVRPYRYEKAIRYLEGVNEYEWPDPEPILEFRKGEPHVRQPQNITRLVSNILRDVAGEEKVVDPFLRWEKIRKDKGRSDIPLIEYNCGKLYDGDLSDAPAAVALQYACSDSNATYQIWPYLKQRVKAEGMWDVFKVDMRVMPMVSDMMKFGIRVDLTKFDELREMFDLRLEEILEHVVEEAGEMVNPNSPVMVSELLYGKLGLGEYVDRKMSKGKSELLTDDAILSRLEQHHPVVKWIREYREYLKLKTSYVEKLPHMVGEDGRIRANFRMTRVATGRLACSEPNLMAMPVRSKDGKLVRDAFIAQDGCWIGCADYSQVEMRVAADQSQDARMCKIFELGEDIHNKTASAMFGIPEGRLDEMKHRYPAKRVGFGVLNDISAFGLQRELVVGGAREGDWPLDRCEELISTWFDIYRGVRKYMDENRAYAARYGKIVDMWGRVRWIPWATVKSSWKREEGLKQAGNTPIQSGAQGVIKRAMAKLQPMYVHYREVMGKRVVPLIQIHDDLVGEYDKKVYEEIMKEQKKVMEGAGEGKMRVPLKVDMKRGERWGSTVKWKQ